MTDRYPDLKTEDIDPLIDRITDALVSVEDRTGQHKYQIADGRIIDSISWNFWEWPQAIGLNGLFIYYVLKSSVSPDAPEAIKTLRIMKEWYRARSAEGTTTKNINSMSVLYSVACLIELDEQRGGTIFTEGERKEYAGWLDEWAEWVMHGLPRTDQGGFQHITFRVPNEQNLWCDTLMMTVMPLAKIGKLLHRPHYIEEAKYQFLIHASYLQDTTTGLWFHGWEFDGKGEGHNFARTLWGRGDCWVTLAIPMFLELLQLETADPVYRSLLSAFTRQVDALLRYQDPKTGLWHTIIDDDTSYLETSASAGFVGGIIQGVRLGLLDRKKYLPPALTGLKACISQVQPNGEVAGCSYGTPIGHNPEFYKNIPIKVMPYGQSLVIVALGEWLRLEGKST